MILKIVAINKVKTYYDFKKYLVLNVKGEKLSNLNFIIDDILKNKDNKKYKNAVKGNDYIQLIMSYATDYCLSKQKNEFYRKLLIAVKEVAGNKKVWPNFNSEDIDYFLNYCGSQNDKAIEI
jgi:hypothetical protein